MSTQPTAELFDVNALLGRLPVDDVGDGSVAELIHRMDRLGVGRAVVAHTVAWRHDPPTGNRLLLREIADQPRLLPCWVVLPDTCGELGGVDQFLTEARQHGVVALRAYPADHGYRLAGRDLAPLLAGAAELALPLLVDAEQTSWAEVEQVAERHPTLPVVVCRTGYRALRELAGVLARTDNVRVDLSYLGSHLGLEWLVEHFGPDRLLFGTGTPVRDPADAVTRLLWSELDDAQVAQIGAGNLHRMLEGLRTA
ncbi:MAG TPA: amidohydrolase family protein [Pseudonocardiaceae bacterium]